MALPRVTSFRTRPEDSEPAERVVVADGIRHTHRAQFRGELQRRAPVGGFAAQEADVARDAGDVRVERDDETRRVDAAPRAGIDAVLAAHPAQEEAEPLRRAAGRGAGEEVAQVP